MRPAGTPTDRDHVTTGELEVAKRMRSQPEWVARAILRERRSGIKRPATNPGCPQLKNCAANPVAGKPSWGVREMMILLATLLLWGSAPPALADDGLRLTAPVPGKVLRVFDPGVGKYSAGHRGVDLDARTGESVSASAPGVVFFAGLVAGVPSVSVDHGNGLRTTYTPVHPSVQKGDIVQSGDAIGTLAAGHCLGTACLHWGLTDGDSYFDPLHYTDSRTIRLLPVGSQPLRRVPLPAALVPAPVGAAPVTGRITSRYGMRVHPVTGVYKLHDGLDFAAPCGTSITLPWAGTVRSAGWDGGYGYRVVVEHDDGLRTAYAHLPGIAVSSGQRLGAGEMVGAVGTTGYSTGCHLHWMAWRDGALIDPEDLLS